MTRCRLIFNSFAHHARSHLGTLLGAIVAGAVLTGSLVVGDSVKRTLQIQAEQRLGYIQAATVQHDRFFRADLAKAIELDNPTHFAPVLMLGAAGFAEDESGATKTRANQIQLIGIDKSFWKHAMLKANLPPPMKDGEALINPRLAAQLGLKAGDEFRLRIAKPSVLPRDAPLSVTEDLTVRLRLTVAKVTSANSELANFSLRPGAVPPFNVFVPLAWLQNKAELDGRANAMLASGPKPTKELVQSANATLKTEWRLADAELELLENETNGVIDLRTDRIFLDANTLKATSDTQTALTYIANEFRLGTNAVPYSMITGVSDGFFEHTPTGDEILITQWLADDLGAKAGDKIEMDYFVLGLNRQLEEHLHTFTVTGIVPTEEPGWRELMPKFPGIVDKDNLRDWNPGIDFYSSRIRDQDEDYWKQHRGTPKAFIALATAQKLWANRYGEATTVRYTFAKGKRAQIESALQEKLNPADIGLVFRDVRTEAITGQSASDFGGLFIGLSFFLVLAALILMGLLFVFGVEQRAPQIGTLLAIGFTGKTVRNLLLTEGLVLALIGAALGAWAGLGYTQALVHLLNSEWGGAIGNGSLVYHAKPLTVLYGVLGGLFVALFTIWLTVRKLSRANAIALLQGAPAQPSATTAGSKAIITAIICAVGAIALGFAMKDAQGQMKAGGFFGAGMLLLISGLCVCHVWLGKLAAGGGSSLASFASLGAMGWRGSARRRGRSLACIGLLACGVFLLIAVGAFRLDPNEGANERWGGTGGFALFGQSDVPVLYDLNTQKGREKMALDGEVNLVQFRVRAGDDASCLNLNQTREPRLLGVNPKALADKKAFTFAQGTGWKVLDETERDAVPAIVDMNTGMWMLHVRVGDVIDYPDESGGTFKIRIAGFLANSVLQGDLIISEKHFVKHFPSASGYRVFLIDSADPKATAAALNFALEDYGLELTPATRRLAEFSQVQNTYLDIFQALGGLALLLGSAGLGVVVLRNVLERRGELALLQAIGFRKSALHWLVLAEHGGLLILGLAAGIISAAVAVWPTLSAPGQGMPLELLAWTVGGILLSGLLWTWLASAAALRGKLLPALRHE
ncbi:MAG: ABC transporter permease [Verrucomicrobia subdivision 3 bacterium]|nr:ABC transporter permease [Limisphaerales bacterium]